MSVSTLRGGLARRAATCGLSVVLGLAATVGGAPAAIADTGEVTTPIYIEPDMSGSSTVDGYGDTQMKVVLPVGISFRATTDGTLHGPSDGTAQITNNSETAVRIAKIQVTSEGGFSLKGSANQVQEASDVYLAMTPGEGSEVALADYATGAAPTKKADWEIAGGDSLGLNNVGGKIGNISSLSPSGKTRVAAINWTVAAGSAETGDANAGQVIVHCVTNAGTISDLTYNRDSGGSVDLPAGYEWHVGSLSGAQVEDTASAVLTQPNTLTEVTVYGIAL
jgi:hypothetical protein